MDRRQHPNVLDVKLFWAADFDTDHYLVVVNLLGDNMNSVKKNENCV
jgi:hypothetical protein